MEAALGLEAGAELGYGGTIAAEALSNGATGAALGGLQAGGSGGSIGQIAEGALSGGLTGAALGGLLGAAAPGDAVDEENIPPLEQLTNESVSVPSTAGESAVGSGLIGDIRPASFVRQISQGENVSDLLDELKQLTFQSRAPEYPIGLEHGIVSLEDGSRFIVSGGQEGIDLGNIDDLDRLIVHTHGAPTGPSPADFNYLLNNGQQSSYIIELGNPNLIHFSVDGTSSEIPISQVGR